LRPSFKREKGLNKGKNLIFFIFNFLFQMSATLKDHFICLGYGDANENNIWDVIIKIYGKYLCHVNDKVLSLLKNHAGEIFVKVMTENDRMIYDIIEDTMKDLYLHTSKEYMSELTEKSIFHTLFIIPLVLKRGDIFVDDFTYDHVIYENRMNRNIFLLIYKMIHIISPFKLIKNKLVLMSSLCGIIWGGVQSLGGVISPKIKLIREMIDDVRDSVQKKRRLRLFFDQECAIYEQVVKSQHWYTFEEDDTNYEIDKLIAF
jgi:hypothetical protein